jgi:sporulation protein YlmC with PRC-barrel domain
MIRKLLATTAIATLVASGAFAQTTDTTEPTGATPQTDTQTGDAVSPDAGESTEGTATDDTDATTDDPATADAGMADVQGHLASNLIGTRVYNGTNDDAENIGSVKDIVIGNDGKAELIVIGVGGFLGIGEKEVALEYATLEWAERDGDMWLVASGQSREQLESEPAFDRASYDPTVGASEQTAATDEPAATTDQSAATTDQPADDTMAATDEPADDTMAATDEPADDTTAATDEPADDTMAATDQPADDTTAATDQPADDTTAATDQQEGEADVTVVAPSDEVDVEVVEPSDDTAAATDQPADDTAAATDQPADDTTAATDQPADDTAAATDQPADDTTAATDQPADDTTAATTDQPADDTVAATDQPADDTTAATDQPADATDETTTAAIDRSQMQPWDVNGISADELMGTTVYGANDEDVGEIGDVILSENGEVDAIIVDVGGFLGIGQKQVAIGMDDLQFMRGENDERHLYTNFTKEQLEAQPEYDESSYAERRDEQRMTVQ